MFTADVPLLICVRAHSTDWLGRHREQMECRVRIGDLKGALFKLWTCSMCYTYLFRDSGELQSDKYKLVYKNKSASQNRGYFIPDIDNETTVAAVCQSLKSNNEDCHRWVSCCRSAIKCCEKQQRRIKTDHNKGYCPQTWDGYSCVDTTRAGTKVYLECPSYISRHRVGSGKCTNSIWLIFTYVQTLFEDQYVICGHQPFRFSHYSVSLCVF